MDTSKYVAFILFFLLVGSCCQAHAQQHSVNQENVKNDKISPSGNGATFFRFQHGKREAVLKNRKSGSQTVFHNIDEPTVLTDTFFIGLNRVEKKLFVHDVVKDETAVVENISDFKWYQAVSRVLMVNSSDSLLILKSVTDGKELLHRRYKRFYLLNDNRFLVIETAQGRIYSYDMDKNKEKELHGTCNSGDLKNVLWNNVLNTMVFIEADSANLHISSVKINKSATIEPVLSVPLKDDVLKTKVDLSYFRFHFMYPDKLALNIRNDQPETTAEIPEIWLGHKNGKGSSDDNRHEFSGLLLIDLLAKNKVYYPLTNENQRFVLSKYPNYFYLAESKDKMNTYEPELKLQFFNVKKQTSRQHFLEGLNPSAVADFKKFPFVFYFKDRNWKYYDLITGRHEEITHNSKGIFYDASNEFYLIVDDPVFQQFPIYKERWILFNDLNDLWFFDTKSKKIERKTNGCQLGKVFRVAPTAYNTVNSDGIMNSERYIKPDKGILLHWTSVSYEKEGIGLLVEDKVVNLMEDQAHYSQIVREGNLISYLKEKSNQPPAMYIFDITESKEYLIYQSNQWDVDIKQQQSVYVQWLNNEGVKRGAVVRFPLNYKEGNTYPAVFNIYEKKMQTQNLYVSDRKTGSGFNYRDYTQAGYFVIEPDIYYRIGDPGFSAMDCVLESLDYVTEHFTVQRENVGLIGHSFGSYQTNFIITQTDKFKAAVSSAGVADLTARYMNINETTLKPDLWRMESQQFRMGKTIAEIPQKYIQNSPVTHASNVKTPLLLWTGKEDHQVNWRNSMGWYILLKRLGKNVNLLQYPDTGHVILNNNILQDAGRKAKQWFDYYLKKEEKPEWLE